MGNAGQFGQQFLDLPRQVQSARRCRGLSPLHRPDARRTAFLRPRISPTCAPAWPAGSRRPRSRSAVARGRSPPSPPRPTPMHSTAAFKTCPRRSAPPTRRSSAPRRMRRSNRRSSPPTASCSTSTATTTVPAARKTVGASALPDGDAYYRAEVREYTTTALSPEDIHQLGLKEVARIDAEMQRDDGRGRLQGQLRRLPQIPPHRSAILSPARPTI